MTSKRLSQVILNNGKYAATRQCFYSTAASSQQIDSITAKPLSHLNQNAPTQLKSIFTESVRLKKALRLILEEKLSQELPQLRAFSLIRDDISSTNHHAISQPRLKWKESGMIYPGCDKEKLSADDQSISLSVDLDEFISHSSSAVPIPDNVNRDKLRAVINAIMSENLSKDGNILSLHSSHFSTRSQNKHYLRDCLDSLFKHAIELSLDESRFTTICPNYYDQQILRNNEATNYDSAKVIRVPSKKSPSERKKGTPKTLKILPPANLSAENFPKEWRKQQPSSQ